MRPSHLRLASCLFNSAEGDNLPSRPTSCQAELCKHMILLFKLLSLLPLRVLHIIGSIAGLVVLLSSPRSRRIARQNIAQANQGASVSPRQAMIHAGRALLELPWIWMRPQFDVVAKVVDVIGQKHVEAARNKGTGIIFLTPHLGCFEITAQYLAAQKPITVLYSRPKQSWLVPLVEQGRGNKLKIAPADMSGVRMLMRALRAGEAIGMLPDQVPGKGDGVWAPFFGKPAYTMTLAARLAKNGSPPTDVNARTGELTPPGINCKARANNW